MDTTGGKLSSSYVWLFALAAVVAGVGSGFLTSGLDWKIGSAIYFGIFAACAFLATYTTKASTGMGVIAFLVGAIATSVFYYLIIKYAVETVTDATTGMAGDDAAKEAGSAFAGMFGMVAAAINGVGTWVAGITGSVAGTRFKKAGGLQQLAALRS